MLAGQLCCRSGEMDGAGRVIGRRGGWGSEIGCGAAAERVITGGVALDGVGALRHLLGELWSAAENKLQAARSMS